MAGNGDIGRREPMLTVGQQIDHFKSKGVTFELRTEEDATSYLSDRTYYFKLAAYRALFDKRIGGKRDGQYVNLDFGHLRALASLDRDLHYALLPLTLDVEHAARTKLVRIAVERDGEDGYSIAADYMAGLNHNEQRRREGEIAIMERDVFCSDLVKKCGKPSDMPVWVLMELFSFGSFTDLHLYYADRWNNEETRHEHYMLRQAKSVRNAYAHSSAIPNGIAASDSAVSADAAVTRALAERSLLEWIDKGPSDPQSVLQNPTLIRGHFVATPKFFGVALIFCDIETS